MNSYLTMIFPCTADFYSTMILHEFTSPLSLLHYVKCTHALTNAHCTRTGLSAALCTFEIYLTMILHHVSLKFYFTMILLHHFPSYLYLMTILYNSNLLQTLFKNFSTMGKICHMSASLHRLTLLTIYNHIII